MYVAGEPGNERDGLLNAIRDPDLRRRLLVELRPAEMLEPGALAGTFDIILERRMSTPTAALRASPGQPRPASVSNMTTQPRRDTRPASAVASARAVAWEVRTLPGET